jgi:hypothetical protein
LQVGGCFTDKSVLNRKKDKEKQKISNSFLRQIRRLGQRVIPHVGGLLAKKSGLDIISKHKKIRQVLFCD